MSDKRNPPRPPLDEMLLAKQQAAASKVFWVLLACCYAFYMVVTILFDGGLKTTWPLLALFFIGCIGYAIMAIHAYLPLQPPVRWRTLIITLVCFGLLLGIVVGVRNTYFLYAHNLTHLTAAGRAWMAVQIAAAFGGSLVVLSLLEVLVLYLVALWQNKRIQRKIDAENEE